MIGLADTNIRSLIAVNIVWRKRRSFMRVKTGNRRRIAALCAAAVGLIAAPTLGISTRLLVWNPTRSMPRGLYVRDSSPASRSEFVLAWLPAEARELAHQRGYLPRTVPALKPIAAIAGDEVCASGDRITINGAAIAERRMEDHQGRPMPLWSGCKTLARNQVFLLSTYAADSFDSRYFGLSETTDIIETVSPVWTFP